MFTLAHLSDPHLAPLPQPSWRELLGKRMTGYANWRRRRRFIHDPAVLAKIVADLQAHTPDHIAVTGDIANIALAAEFSRGRKWLESLGSATGVSFVPGNHDAYVAQGLAFTEREWGVYMHGDDGAGGFPFVRRRKNVALIGVSTGVPTAPFLATGRVGAKQLAKLATVLEQLKREEVFRVVLIHHPPVSAAAWHKRLIDAPELLQVIATQSAELLIHGHDHLHMVNWLKGPNETRVPAVGVPSASAVPGAGKDAAAYNLYRIDGAPGAWTCEMISRGITPEGEVKIRKRMRLL
jgi:3',5'-cyclic AMP phosphodiesterase CpdA